MEKHNRPVGKNQTRRRINQALAAICLLSMFSFGFFIGNRIAAKRSAIVSAANTVKDTQEDSMNGRESKMVPNTMSTLNTTESPGEYKPWSVKRSDGKKIAYLTFDDGPSSNNTPKILDILKQNNIKATFFVIGKNAEVSKDLVKREIADGNVVGNHTYSHQLNYREGPENFVQDLNRCDAVLKSIIGNNYNLKLIRFPGGSFGARLKPFRESVTKEGYHYIDWNDITGDAEHNNVSTDSLLSELKRYTSDDTVVILMHDAATKTTTVQALPQVIEYLRSKGYTFDTLK